MLPSTKLFKNINCPFFDDNGECTRPYCHYSHAKTVPTPPHTERNSESTQDLNAAPTIDSITQEIQLLEPPVPVYVPTPKHILEARKENESKTTAAAAIVSQEPAKKRPKLEYVPQPKHPVDNVLTALTYVPSTRPSPSDEYVPLKDSNETDDLAGIRNELILTNEIIQSNDESVEAAKEASTSKNDEKSLESNGPSKSSESKGKSSSRHRSSSKSSHRSSHRSDRQSTSHRSNTNSQKKSSSSHSNFSSSRNKSKYSEKDKARSSSNDDKEKNGGRKSSSTSSSSSHRRSSSHKHNHHRSNSSERKSKSNSISKKKTINFDALMYESELEEDDVEAQCRMIFEEFDPETVTPASDPDLTAHPGNDASHDPMVKHDDSSKRKRVAYENAESQQKPMKSFSKSTNHVQNALQSVFRRQEIVRKQLEEKQQKEQEELAKVQAAQLNEAKRKSIEQEQNTKLPKHNSTTKLTPLIAPIPLANQRYYSKFNAPISNVLAIQKAKEKVEQLRAAKLQQQPNYAQTIAHTAAKGAARVAHTSTTSAAQTSPSKPAPPVLEASSTKISYNIRMQYYNLMVKHCLTIYDECTDAWERAQTEELIVFKKCSTPVTYKSSALLAINRLRKESLDAGNVNTEKGKVISHDVILAGKLGQQVSWSVNKKTPVEVAGSTNVVDTISSSKAYLLIAGLCLAEDQLKNNGYPRAGIKSGMASIFATQKAAPNNENDRYCRRCGKTFTLDHYDDDCMDQCNYHPKSPGYRRGHADHAHRCCQLPAGSPGCMYANYHVSDYMDYKNLTGFIKTIECDANYVPSRKDVFALDCEMCYTTVGLELTRVTVVDINRKIVYDALVKPTNKIVDYNTTYSGITEKTLQNVTRTLRDVQAVLLSMFNSKTILIGHSLESDFKALKLIHDCVVDTSVLYPHKMGPPMKRALKTLCIENLKRIIQEDEAGHNSAEDAEVCIDLVKHYLRNHSA